MLNIGSCFPARSMTLKVGAHLLYFLRGRGLFSVRLAGLQYEDARQPLFRVHIADSARERLPRLGRGGAIFEPLKTARNSACQ